MKRKKQVKSYSFVGTKSNGKNSSLLLPQRYFAVSRQNSIFFCNIVLLKPCIQKQPSYYFL